MLKYLLRHFSILSFVSSLRSWLQVIMNHVFKLLDFQGDLSFRHFGYLSKTSETRFCVGVYNVESEHTSFFHIPCHRTYREFETSRIFHPVYTFESRRISECFENESEAETGRTMMCSNERTF